jgi:recombination protein RecR
MLKISSFEKCLFEFNKLPGVGRKTALRFILHLIKMSNSDVENLAKSILELKSSVKFCSICGCLTEREICEFCSSNHRNREIICVVEEAKDVLIIESAGRFNGLYHVLGGRISPIDGIGPDELNIKMLLKRLNDESLKEVIIATNPDIEGETTAIYLAKKISEISAVSVTRIASGVPIGGQLEYADDITILKALENRQKLV